VLRASSVVILTDPPVDIVRMGPGRGTRTVLRNTPYDGGYRDFIRRDHIDIGTTLIQGPPRTCLFDDLIFYLTTYPHLIRNWTNPAITTLFLTKIVASHYLQLAEFTRSVISHFAWRLSRHERLTVFDPSLTETQWSDLQGLNRRCEEYVRDAELAMLALGLTLNGTEVRAPLDWLDYEMDFRAILHHLLRVKERAGRLETSITSLSGIINSAQSLAETKRSLREAKMTRALTLVGLIFIPLAYSASVFSMAEDYNPGGQKFWIYFAVSLPMVLIVFGFTYALKFVIDDSGKFRWEFRRTNSGKDGHEHTDTNIPNATK
jgi:hypothetical protein